MKPELFEDERGFFFESWNLQNFQEFGIETNFVQENQSRSSKHVLRGMHYQISHPQGKLVKVLSGAVFDVAIDLRRSSSTFGNWVGVHLSSDMNQQMWIPPGFAHGFLVLSDYAEFQYKCTDYYAPEYERTLAWNDEQLGIEWPLVDGKPPIVSEKDSLGKDFESAETYQ